MKSDPVVQHSRPTAGCHCLPVLEVVCAGAGPLSCVCEENLLTLHYSGLSYSIVMMGIRLAGTVRTPHS